MPDMWMDVDTALSEVPVNIMPLLDDGDFKTRETSVAYNATGMDLVWNFVTTDGAYTQTAVTPTTSGTYDWAHQGDGMYSIEIPASGGASINNDTEGFGWFTGLATGVLPWRGPIIGFRAAGLNNLLIDDAYSTTRGLSGTALPNAAADAAGGLPISDAGGLDLDAQVGTGIDNLVSRLGTPSNLGGGATVAANLADIEAQTDDIGAAGAGLTALASAANLATVAGYLDTEVAAILAAVDTEVAAILADTNELQTDWADGGRLDLILDTAAAGGGGGLDAAGVRAAIGMSSANLDTQLGTIDTNVDAILVDTAEIGAAGAGLSAIPWNAAWDAEVQSEATDALNAYDPPTNAEMVARTLASADYATATALDAVDNYVDTEIAAIQSSLSTIDGKIDTVDSNVDAALADTNELQTDWVDGGRLDLILDARASQSSVDDLPTNSELATALGTADDATLSAISGLDTKIDTIGTNVDSVLADTGTDGVVVATGSKTGYALSNTGIDAILTRAITEAYSTKGGTLTIGSALYEIVQHLQEHGISGTTWTIKKRDGSTSALTLTLDDGTSPTAATRAT